MPSEQRIRSPVVKKHHSRSSALFRTGRRQSITCNAFSPAGRSAYEEGGLSGLFSQMTHEQLVNWVLCAGVWLTGAPADESAPWLEQSIGIFRGALTSLVNRDHPDPAMRDGIMSADSSRTLGGSEITTYDSLDTSLGQGAPAACAGLEKRACRSTGDSPHV